MQKHYDSPISFSTKHWFYEQIKGHTMAHNSVNGHIYS